MSEYGIIIAEDGQTIRSGRAKVDSRRARWIVDLEADPKHMDLILTTAGTALADRGNFETQRETLATIDHKYGFTPVVAVYFYVISDNGSTNTGLAQQYTGELLVLSGTSGIVNDAVTYEVDKNQLRIYHSLFTRGFPPNYTSPAPKYSLRVKYYIMAVDSGSNGYSGSDNFIG